MCIRDSRKNNINGRRLIEDAVFLRGKGRHQQGCQRSGRPGKQTEKMNKRICMRPCGQAERKETQKDDDDRGEL